MKLEYRSTRTPLLIGIGFLVSVILAEFSAIMFLNNGLLVYTLDDPYIHLALAENIKNGHYGVNKNEISAPSSSILWPFIIAPFSSYEYFPFLANISAAIVTVYIFVKILYAALKISDKRINDILVSSFLVLLIFATNIIGLIFTGMEHSLQVLVASVIAYGLIVEVEKNKVEPWLLVSIVAAPLIRYENIAISIAALGYLVMRRYFKESACVMLSLFVFVGGFSLFLTLLGLGPFPTSILAKSSFVESGGTMYSIMSNMRDNLSHRTGVILSLGVLALSSCLLFTQDIKKKQLSLVAIFAIFMHFIAGRHGWGNRYEIYIWSFCLLVSLYLSGSQIINSLERANRKANLIKVVIIAMGFVVVTGYGYIVDLFTLPIASNNIYEQQYQMHRFAVDYYNKPVAVNDLGYVSYKNDNYVLDLWGLASVEAFNYRKYSDSSDWMNKLSVKHNIQLAMIYDWWFKGVIPNEWIKIGELHLGKMRFAGADSKVSFYAMDQSTYSDIVEKLYLFTKTLPPGVKFTFKERVAASK